MQTQQALSKFKKVSIYAKALIMLLPVIISSFIVSNFLVRNSFEKTMTTAGIQLMSYKAEQLKKYADMQWLFLINNSLENDKDYIDAVKQAVRIYSINMTAIEDEVVFTLSKSGNIDFTSVDLDISSSEIRTLENKVKDNLSEWIEVTLNRVEWVGLTFYYQPMEWQIFILDKKNSFYELMYKANRQHQIIIITSILLSVLTIILFIRYLTYPIKKIADEMSNIKSIDDISRDINILYPDETGQLAFEFNKMSRRLVKSYTQLKNIAIKEAVSSREITLRELETLEVLSRSSDYKDPETGDHILRVSHYSRMLASLMELSGEDQELIFYASPLHDIGKLGIPDSILLKPGKLSESEFEIIKTHPVIAYNILSKTRSKYLQAGAVIAQTHHEKYDGNGYPYGLKGEEIPVFGRIVAIADVFDALTTSRPYKEPWPFEKAVEYLESQYGRHFDPAILKFFISNIESVRKIHSNIDIDS